ncbi:MAG: hypothetical protein KBD76_09800 [Bacteriovorax sp.]|nr:hypothetical protein [Bacteriovorax sp.]
MKQTMLYLTSLLVFLNLAPYARANSVTLSANPTLTQSLSSCYRWMNYKEYKSWKKGKAHFGYIDKNTNAFPYTDSTRRKGVYCFFNPIGAIAGQVTGLVYPEYYGSYLVRIEFAQEALFYNVNLDQYFQDNQQVEPNRKLRLGINSPIIYHSLDYNGFFWQQEIIIQDPKAIKTWTFDDEKLRKEFYEFYTRLMNNDIFPEDFHFAPNGCYFIDPHKKPTKEACKKYRELALKNKKNLDSLWQ